MIATYMPNVGTKTTGLRQLIISGDQYELGKLLTMVMA